jgi:hypothetical protein
MPFPDRHPITPARAFLKRVGLLLSLVWICLVGNGQARDFSENPNRSLFVTIDLGAGLDLMREGRSPPNWYNETVEAYTQAAFLIGVDAGYRFNELIAIEAGWHDEQHKTHPEWGGRAHYMLGHVALRLAWPTKVRQTPVFFIGPAIGQFSYGSASYGEVADNSTLVVGGMTALALEHELTLGMVATLKISYIPAARFGMDGVLVLEEVDYSSPDYQTQLIGEKDFTKRQFVQILWITLGIQFEWSFL